MSDIKVIQIVYANAGLFGGAGFIAVDDQGRVWSKTADYPNWKREKLPQEPGS